VQELSSTAALNDGAWHHVVSTLSSAGMQLYVDGVLVASNTGVTSAQNYSGYWTIGYENLTAWANSPSSFYFNGQLDDVRVYYYALSAAQVAALYAMGTSAPVITSALTATGTAGTGFSYTITASNNSTSYNATPLPAGLSINTTTGVISGQPTTAGTTNLTISATNAGGTGSATLALTINQIYAISGTITLNGGGLAGVTVSCSAGSATTDGSGAYSISGATNGSYSLTPALVGYTFSPTSQVVQVNGGNATQNFTATQNTYSITGSVTQNGNGLSWVTVNYGGNNTVTTGSNGNFTISGLSNNTYTLTPSLSGYTFLPASEQVVINGSSQTAGTFAATVIPNTFSITGSVTLNGTGLSGVAINYGSNNTVTTASDGSFAIGGLSNSTYTLTPSLSGYTFLPTSENVTINGSSQTAGTFSATAIPNTYSIIGSVTLNRNGLSGVTINYGGNNMVTTASDGSFTIGGLGNNTYTLTPSLSGYTFLPASENITINESSQTAGTFVATAVPNNSITGSVTLNGTGLSGVTVNYGGNNTVTTNSSGAYTISGLANGSYTLTPSLAGYTFNPTSQTIAVSNGNASQNFTATVIPKSGTVATPTFSPAAGSYNSAQIVTISCATSGANIYYTTDRTTPAASSTKYTGPISISASTQLQAIAIETGMTSSLVISGVYNIAGSSTYVPDTYNDTDGNGYPDEVKTALGVSLTNPSATPLNMQVGITPQALTLSKLSVKLNFAKTTGNDEIMVSGSLPIVAGFVASSQNVVVDVGGVVKIFTLSSKGDGTGATGYPAVTSTKNDHFDLKFKSVNGKVSAQMGTFTAQFNKGTFALSFADMGLLGRASVNKVTRTVPVIILFNNQMYQAAQAVQYTATANKTGVALWTSKP